MHLVHEARGLDTYAQTRERLARAGDEASVAVIERNHGQEVGHVAAGRRWLLWLCTPEGRAHTHDDYGATLTAFGEDVSCSRTPSNPEAQAISLYQTQVSQAHRLQVVINWKCLQVRLYMRGGLKPPFNVPAR